MPRVRPRTQVLGGLHRRAISPRVRPACRSELVRDDSFSYQHFGKIEKQVPDAPVVESMPTNAELLRASSAPSLMVANPTSNKAFASPFDGRRVSAVWSRLPRFADNSQGPQSRAHQPSHGAHFAAAIESFNVRVPWCSGRPAWTR